MANLVLGGTDYKNIKNIIFDLGGVIVDIDFTKTINAFKQLGIEDFDKFFTQFKQNPLFDKLDKGLVSENDFRNGVREIAKIDISDTEFDIAWNAMLLELPAKRVATLRNLKNHFPTFLLSNTNEIHLTYFFKRMKIEHDLDDFSSLFHKAYYSCRIEMRKPDAEIYEKVLADNKLIASETLFVDDLDFNVDAAMRVGIQGYIMKKSDELADLFNITL